METGQVGTEPAHQLCILNGTGDTKIIWDSKNEDEVENAKRTFDDLKAKGYIAYSVSKDGSKDKVLKKFDPDAEKIIMVAPIAGG